MMRALDNQQAAEEAEGRAQQGRDGPEGQEGLGGEGGSPERTLQHHQQQQQQHHQQQRQSLQAQLDEAKSNYRAGYMELQLCKRQMAEAQLLKKRAMSGLVGAFDKLASAMRVPLP